VITAGGVLIKTRLVRIGNSRGIRLPKPLIQEAGLTEEVELRVRPGAIVIAPAPGPRAGWAEAAQRLAGRGEGRLLEVPTLTRFDDEEWEW
jgi:antitoxin MazE